MKVSPINKTGTLNFVTIRSSLIVGTLSTTIKAGFNVSYSFNSPSTEAFIGEFLIYVGLLGSLRLETSGLFILVILSIAALALVGTLAILCFTKIYSITFLGLPRDMHSQKVKSDVDKVMLIPMGILSVLTLIIGVLSPIVFIPVACSIEKLVGAKVVFANLMIVLSLLVNVLLFVGTFIAIFAVVYLLKKFCCKKSVIFNTWGCGYDKGNNHIQYTASSFVSPFASILTPLFKKIFDVKKPKGLFPKDAHYNSQIEDVEEAYLINPIVKFDEKFLSKFERLQDGNIQHYILYGLIFLILTLIGVVFLG